MGDWVRVCVLWDMGHHAPTARKSTTSFTKYPSLVGLGPILNEIQPFKNFKKFTKKCMDSRTYEGRSWTRCSTRRFVMAFHRFRTPILLVESLFFEFDSAF